MLGLLHRERGKDLRPGHFSVAREQWLAGRRHLLGDGDQRHETGADQQDQADDVGDARDAVGSHSRHLSAKTAKAGGELIACPVSLPCRRAKKSEFRVPSPSTQLPKAWVDAWVMLVETDARAS